MVRAVLISIALVSFGCEGPDPILIGRCSVDGDCIDGRRCFEGLCAFENPSPSDAGLPDGGAMDAGLDGCVAEVATGVRCSDPTQLFCPLLVDGRISSSWEIVCSDDPSLPGCTPEGQFDRLDLRMEFEGPTTLRGVRFLSDWFSKRPLEFQLWGASTATTALESGGATLVLSKPAAEVPWLCVPDAVCDYYTPDICCPQGRDAPIDISLSGTDQAKYDFGSFPATQARFWTLRFIGADSGDALFLKEVELLTGLCVERL